MHLILRMIRLLRRLRKSRRSRPIQSGLSQQALKPLDIDTCLEEWNTTMRFFQNYEQTYKRMKSDQSYMLERPERYKRHRRVTLSVQDYYLVSMFFEPEFKFLKNWSSGNGVVHLTCRKIIALFHKRKGLRCSTQKANPSLAGLLKKISTSLWSGYRQ